MTTAQDRRRFLAEVAGAYGRTGDAWSTGPALVYDRLAAALVAASPVPLAGRTVVDVGAGTGAASLAVVAAGGRAVAVDLAPPMLRAHRAPVVGAIAGDATALPLGDATVDGVVAAFSLNHLPDPVAGFREARRVCRPGSPVLAAAYAADDDHPVKRAVDQAAAECGWRAEPWYDAMRATVTAQLATTEGMAAAAAAAGLPPGGARRTVVDMPDLAPAQLVAWRLGMAQVAPFLATAGHDTRERVTERALDLLGPEPPPLRRSIVVYAATT